MSTEFTAEEVRARFEKWVSTQPWAKATLGLMMTHDAYTDPCINSRWQGWQAAYADTLSKPADSGRVVGALVDIAMKAAYAFDTTERLHIDYDTMEVALEAALAAQGQGEAFGWVIPDGEGGYSFRKTPPSDFDREWADKYNRHYTPVFDAPPASPASPEQPASRQGEIDALIDAAHAYAEKYKDDDRQDVITDVLNAFYQGTDWRRKHTVAPAGVPGGWSGWCTQMPGRLPKLWGAIEVAELNYSPEDGWRMFKVVEVAAPSQPEDAA